MRRKVIKADVMTRGILTIIYIYITFASAAQQQYPQIWLNYMTEGYVYDVQSDYNGENKDEIFFKEYLANLARTSLAKQIEVKVEDIAKIAKYSLDGRTATKYVVSTKFSTNVDLKFAKTLTFYNPDTKQGYALAYINKKEAQNYYENELHLLYNKIESAMQLADRYISDGHKPKARHELENILPDVSVAEDCLLWLNILGMQREKLIALQNYITDKKQELKSIITELAHGVSIYLTCSSDMFGSSYAALQDKLKGVLSESGCNFANTRETADYSITVKCTSRKYNTVPFGKGYSYVSYVDASISIDNVVASQRIYENIVSIKGVHIINYTEAARVAYDKVGQQLGPVILKNIRK